MKLNALWQELSGAKPRSEAGEKKRLARWDKYLKQHTVEELAGMVRGLALERWWRGDNQDQRDVFKEGPHRFLNDPEKVEARIAAAAAPPARHALSQAKPGMDNRAAWLADWRESLDAFDSACRFNGFERSTDGFHDFISKHRKMALPIPADVTALVGRRIERNA